MERIQETIRKMRAKQAPGMEGWRVAELKRLPKPILAWLADRFNAIEETGEWPAALLRALVTLLSKGKGPVPLDTRPISVLSPIYRLWAAIRVQDPPAGPACAASEMSHSYHL